jgi:Zn-finger nucleic acid-binding protein
MTMQCPRCRTALETSTTEGVRFERCAACDGLALAVPVLRRFAPEGRVRDVWLDLPEARPGAACPSCSNAMREISVDCDGAKVAIDVCKACQLLWFDAKELEQFSPERQAPAPRTDRLSPKAAEACAVAEIAAREQMQQDREDAAAIAAALWLASGSSFAALIVMKRLAEQRR